MNISVFQDVFRLEKPNFHNRRIYSAVWIGNCHPAWKAEHLFATKAQRQEVGCSLFAGMDIHLCNCSGSAFQAAMVETSSSAGRDLRLWRLLPFRQWWAGELKTSTAMNISVFQDVFRLEKPNFHNRRIYSAAWIGSSHPAWKAEHLFATKAQRQEVGFSLSAGMDIHLCNCSGSAFQAAMVGTSSSEGRWPAVMKVIAFQATVSRWIEKLRPWWIFLYSRMFSGLKSRIFITVEFILRHESAALTLPGRQN